MIERFIVIRHWIYGTDHSDEERKILRKKHPDGANERYYYHTSINIRHIRNFAEGCISVLSGSSVVHYNVNMTIDAIKIEIAKANLSKSGFND